MNKKSDIVVTQPLLPPLAEFVPYLKKIWDNKAFMRGVIFIL